MKAGDKLYCIKTLIHLGRIFFSENKQYQIKDVSNYNIEIINEFPSYFLASCFHLAPYNNEDSYNFYEHFITEKEYRKLKLKKINETRRRINV